MKFSRLSAVMLFWPALGLVVWGELVRHGGDPFHIWDKLLHFTAYFGLMGIAGVALGGRRRVLWAALGLIVLGGALEIIQGMVGRDMSLYDEFANTLGVLTGLAAAAGYLRLLGGRLVAREGAD